MGCNKNTNISAFENKTKPIDTLEHGMWVISFDIRHKRCIPSSVYHNERTISDCVKLYAGSGETQNQVVINDTCNILTSSELGYLWKKASDISLSDKLVYVKWDEDKKDYIVLDRQLIFIERIDKETVYNVCVCDDTYRITSLCNYIANGFVIQGYGTKDLDEEM